VLIALGRGWRPERLADRVPSRLRGALGGRVSR